MVRTYSLGLSIELVDSRFPVLVIEPKIAKNRIYPFDFEKIEVPIACVTDSNFWKYGDTEFFLDFSQASEEKNGTNPVYCGDESMKYKFFRDLEARFFGIIEDSLTKRLNSDETLIGNVRTFDLRSDVCSGYCMPPAIKRELKIPRKSRNRQLRAI